MEFTAAELLKALQIFKVVATAGSMGHAAQQLHLAQSAISKWIARLEQALQSQLLIRTHQGTTLTSAGQELFQWCNFLLPLVQNTFSTLREHLNETSQHQQETPILRAVIKPTPADIFPCPQIALSKAPLRIGIATPNVKSISGQLCYLIATSQPESKVVIQTGFSPEILRRVETGQLLFGIVNAATTPATVQSILLETQQIYLVSPQPLSQAPICTEQLLELLSKKGQILFSSGVNFRIALEEQFHAWGIDMPHAVAEVDTIEMALQLVKAGMGYALLPSSGAWEPEAQGVTLYDVTQLFLAQRTFLILSNALFRPSPAKQH